MQPRAAAVSMDSMKRIGQWLLAGVAGAAASASADVARIGATTYPTLHAAVAAAPSNAVIELIGDAVLTNVLSISRPVAIASDGAVRRIVRTNAFADDMIFVQPPGALTLGTAAGSDAAPTLILDGGATNGVAGGFSCIFANKAGVVVQPGVVLRNYRGFYAPLYGLNETNPAALVLNGGLFHNNASTNSSGGALCSQGMAVYVRNAVFASNAAPRGRGGAIYVENAVLAATNLVVRDNAADDYGGGIMGYPANVILSGGSISGNSAINGGGYANGYGNLIADGTTIASNQAYHGGGVWSHTGANELRSATIRDNHAAGYGGGLYSTSSGYALSNCLVVGNGADSYGGGLYVTPTANPASAIEIVASSVSSNVGLFGGAIYCSYASLAVADSTFAGNRAAGPGGAIWLFGDADIRDVRIAANVSSNEGGGIFHLGGPLALSGQTRFEANSAAAGNGLWCYNGTYEGSNAVLSLAGGVSFAGTDGIALHTNENAILLAGVLAGPGTVATLVPPVYSNGLPLLRDGSGLSFSPTARYYAKFAVAPQPASSTNWFVGTNGNLAAVQPPAPPAPPAGLRDIARLATASNALRLDVDSELLKYDFSLQAADTVTNGGWNFETLLGGYAVATNGAIALDAAGPRRMFRLVFP